MNETISRDFEIKLSGIGKKFNSRWIFRGINLNIKQGDRIAINGNNGSGKSTLLKLISGYLSPYEGTIQWYNANAEISLDQLFKHLSFASPYLDLIEPFTLEENINFFCRMKPLLPGVSNGDVIKIASLEYASSTPVQNLSSGMKQRLKLSLAFLADTNILLLDEPLSNLDASGYDWYKSMSEKYLGNRILLVCSNRVIEETAFCTSVFDVEKYK